MDAPASRWHLGMIDSATSLGALKWGWPFDQRPARLCFDFQQAVVLAQTLRLRQGANLDLVSAPPGCGVGEPIVLRFPAPGTDRHMPMGRTGKLACFQCFRQRPDLVRFEKQGVSGLFLNGTPDSTGIGAQEIIPHPQASSVELTPEPRPMLPIVLGQAVLEA